MMLFLIKIRIVLSFKNQLNISSFTSKKIVSSTKIYNLTKYKRKLLSKLFNNLHLASINSLLEELISKTLMGESSVLLLINPITLLRESYLDIKGTCRFLLKEICLFLRLYLTILVNLVKQFISKVLENPLICMKDREVLIP